MTAPVSLSTFLHEASIEPEDLYRTRGWSWTRLKREAGHERPAVAYIADRPAVAVDRDETILLNAIGRLLHIDDEPRLSFLMKVLAQQRPPQIEQLPAYQRRLLEGFLLTLWADQERDVVVALQRLWFQPTVRHELCELLGVLDDRAPHQTFALASEMSSEAGRTVFADVPLQVHASYTRDEVLAAIGRATLAKPLSSREGVLWHEPTNTDYFFVTLDKSEKYYSPSTRYRDYAISPDVFHWESQSQTPEKSPTGQRYIHHEKRGSHVMLFVRTRNKDANGRTLPFTFLGSATHVEHKGERPMAIVWKLYRPMPLDFFSQAKVAAG